MVAGPGGAWPADGADGTLTGYGWGTARKAWLLNHEGRPGIDVGG